MTEGVFSNSVQEYLRASGHSQKQLADALGLHPQVLNRKLRGNRNAHLTQAEVKCIITTLALWNAITTQDEAFQLLNLAQMKSTCFPAEAWHTHPLSQLAADCTPPNPAGSFSKQTQLLRHNLPAHTTRLVGREQAVEQLRCLLVREEVRLVTITGAGGSGKTRLALQVASELVDAFAHGVYFVALDVVNDAKLVPISIIHGVRMTSSPSLPPMQNLTNHLRDKKLLLVLDNFEQVAEAAPIVSELLAAAPGIKVLVTSRVVLHLYGERQFNVLPLDIPNPRVVLDMTELAQYGAIQLFVDRAQAVMPDFTLTAGNAPIIAQICARLDGLPLALELAAAWVKLLPPALLLQRLSEAGLSLLTRGARNLPSRQQTLRNTLTQSYQLLDEEDQRLFRQISVFVGGCTLDAVEDVCAHREKHALSAMEGIASLLDKSLLVQFKREGEEPRLFMLETIREYGLERLREHKEAEAIQRAHALYYLAFVEQAEQHRWGSEQITWLERLEREQENVRAALTWLIEREEAGLTLRFCGALGWYWLIRSYWGEGRHWLEAALRLPHAQGRTAGRAKALSTAGEMAYYRDAFGEARILLEESVLLYRELKDKYGLALALRALAALTCKSDLTAARALITESIALARETGDSRMLAFVLSHAGDVMDQQGDYEATVPVLEESIALCLKLGEKIILSHALSSLGRTMQAQGDPARAGILLQESLALARETGDKRTIVCVLQALAEVLICQDQHIQAVPLLEESQVLACELCCLCVSLPATHLHRIAT